jgi:hypothetical protein
MEKANFFWYGKPISLYEKLCLQSFIKNGFEVNVWSYMHLDIPEGANLKNAEEILSEEHLFKYSQDGKQKNMAAFSDVFRFNLTSQKSGEWWFDIDCICLKPASEFSSLKDNRPLVIGWEDRMYANGAVLNIPDKQIGLELIEEQRYICETVSNIPWGEIGPRLLTKFCHKKNISDLILSREVFYPIHYNQTELFFDTSNSEKILNYCSNSYTCHLWNEILHRRNVNKNELPRKGTFLNKMFETYLD